MTNTILASPACQMLNSYREKPMDMSGLTWLRVTSLG